MDRYVMANAVFSKFSRDYMELKRALPIRPSEMGVLNIITQTQGPHTPVQIAAMLGVSKPMVAAHLSVLGKKGYVTKEPSPTDKRSFYVLPTEKAVELVHSTMAETEHTIDRLIDGMGADAFDTLVTLVRQANEILEQKTGKEGSYGSQR